jgi:hypothetical protein
VNLHLASSVRAGAAALAAAGALVAAGCGSSGPHHLAHHHLASATSFTAVHTDQQIMQHFQAATGHSLTVNHDTAIWDTLSLPSSDTQGFDHYGAFTIDVLHKPDQLTAFTTAGGRRLVADANGIYWPAAPDNSGYWNPSKIYGNVVLSWTTQTRSVDAQFRMLDAILSTLGQTASAVEAKLPPSQRSCQAQGITPSGTTEGTCTDDGVSLTVVNRNHTLHTAGYDVQIVKTKLGNIIKPPFAFGTPDYAKGQFVVLVLHVTNTGDNPLEGLDEAELKIDGRYYSQDFEATSDLAEDAGASTTFPLQPQDSGDAVMVFDVPNIAAASALAQGELVFPDGADATIDYSSKLGAIRLSRAAPAGTDQRSPSAGESQPAPAGSQSQPAPAGSDSQAAPADPGALPAA